MKKSDRITLRETLSIHLRAVRDANNVAPGVFVPTILSAIAEAVSPYMTIWFSAQIINELAYARRIDELMKWVLLTISVTAVMGLIRAGLERWDTAWESVYYKKYTKLKTARSILTEQIEKALEELNYLDSVEEAMARVENEEDILVTNATSTYYK